MAARGNHGLWIAVLLFMAARGLWLVLVDLDIERGAGFDAGLSRPAPAADELSSPAPVGLGL